MRQAVLVLAALLLAGHAAAEGERARWAAEAARVEIVRDDLGIAHVRGHTDADSVFGAIYAQAEDDFPRIEANYLTALGRTAEADGEGAIWTDLRRRLFVDPERLKAAYRASPAWLVRLMDAWADGLNAYLAAHPEVHPKVLIRFEPWMALAFSEGSIGGDDERVGLAALRAFYDGPAPQEAPRDEVAESKGLTGSNGIAIGPSRSKSGHALLLINPHTSFFFRSELQMTSDEGLNAFGAATWGQFFLYQGWNEHAGWMNTSTGADNVDEFAETVVRGGGGAWAYRYGAALRPVSVHPITLSYRRPDGALGQRTFQVQATRHGPVVRMTRGRWIAVAMMDRPVEALEQSFLRTKAHTYGEFARVAALKANASNNTLFADDKGEIAFLTPQFMPRRDDRFDYLRPVDGADPATDWKGLHSLDELPQVVNPASGFVVNTNNAPWFSAGPDSPKAAAYPRYMDTLGQNYRGVHALRLLQRERRFSQADLRDLAFDPALPAFDDLLPPLFAAWDALPEGAEKARLAGAIGALRAWDRRWSADSVATTLASAWAATVWNALPSGSIAKAKIDALKALSPEGKLAALDRAVAGLQRDFGDWRVPWGEVNRYQRPDGIANVFNDAKSSLPAPFASAVLGSLAAFESHPFAGTKRWYGYKGNSFVAVVEFGPRVRALAVTTGGESGHPGNPHFADQAERYLQGDLEPVPFHPDEIAARAVRRYHPKVDRPRTGG